MNRACGADCVIGRGWQRSSREQVFKEGLWDQKSLQFPLGPGYKSLLCLLQDLFSEAETCSLMLLCGQLLLSLLPLWKCFKVTLGHFHSKSF